MKNFTKLLMFILFIIAVNKKVNSQNPYWQAGGNISTGLDGVTSANNQLGTFVGNPTDLNFITNGNTNMTILNSNGYVGIGTVNPAQLLEVTGGNIHISGATNSYMLGGFPIIWHNGITSNIYVGVGAGNSSSTALKNTFVGYQAGTSSTSVQYGDLNTFIGYWAGTLNTEGRGNTFVGVKAGENNSTGNWNTFTGILAGDQNDVGSKNSYYGKEAGYSNTSGAGNTCIGDHCGYSNVSGFYNTMIGSQCGELAYSYVADNLFGGVAAGYSDRGDRNVFMGRSAGFYHTWGNENTYLGYKAQNDWTNYLSLTKSTTLGAYATASADDQMILGDNDINVGIGLSDDVTSGLFGPRDKLEINLGLYGTDPVPVGDANFYSGLQFRDLLSTNIPTANPSCPNCAVLSVDAAGRVILVKENSGGVGIGLDICTGTLLPAGPSALGAYAMQMNGNNISFYDGDLVPARTDYNINSFTIGWKCLDPLGAKFDVLRQNSSGYPVVNPIGIRVNNWEKAKPDAFGNTTCYGLEADVLAPNFYNYGGNFNVNGGTWNIGAKFNCTDGSLVPTHNIGIQTHAAKATGVNTGILVTVDDGFFSATTQTGIDVSINCFGISNTNYGGRFNAYSANPWSTNNYGVYAYAPAPNGALPFPNTNWAGYFNGAVYASGYIGPSDSIFKTNVDTIPDAIGIIKQLQPHIYKYDTSNYSYMSFPGSQQYGLIAQEVERVIPNVVSGVNHPAQFDTLGNQISPSLNFKALNYTAFIPILIQSAKTQQNLIDTLTAHNNLLEQTVQNLSNIVNNCCDLNQRRQNMNDNGGNGSGENNNIVNFHSLSLSTEGVILYQNTPNPFGNGTEIRYSISVNFSNASIVFYDEYGKRIKDFNITEKGEGELKIDASNLASGVYNYSLFVDQKLIDSKKMLHQK